MQELNAQLKALRERHQITILQLSDLKDDNERLKKINTTLVQNLTKQTADPLTQIKLIIEGDQYHLRIVQLQQQIELLNNKMNQEIQKRVKQISQNLQRNQIVQECQKCKQGCQKCKRGCDQCHILKKIISQKNDTIDGFVLDLEEARADLQIKSAKSLKYTNRIKQLENSNRILNDQLEKYQRVIRQNEDIENQWEKRYENLNQQHQLALDQINQLYRVQVHGPSSYTSPQHKRLDNNSNYRDNKENKEQMMKKKIQNLADQIVNRKTSHSPINKKGLGKSNVQSRLLTDSDYSAFSIKDAINRPNQANFY